MKSILIGSVGTSKTMLKVMIEVNFPISYVFSIDEQYSANISGYCPIHILAESNGIPFKKIRRINDVENVKIIKELQPDYIFVIGFSQLVKKEIIDSAKIGVIGFHPTPLPKMRGRAANAWQVLLGIHETKCTLFFINEQIDSGDILGQQQYIIDDEDYAIDVERKINEALYKLAKKILTEIKNGIVNPIKQNDADATYLLKRSPEDGKINWDSSIIDIHRLIRAVSKPYPGAFGHYDGKHKIIIWRAEMKKNIKYIGMPGQIAYIGNGVIDVVCKDGLLHITDYENIDLIKMYEGHKLK